MCVQLEKTDDIQKRLELLDKVKKRKVLIKCRFWPKRSLGKNKRSGTII